IAITAITTTTVITITGALTMVPITTATMARTATMAATTATTAVITVATTDAAWGRLPRSDTRMASGMDKVIALPATAIARLRTTTTRTLPADTAPCTATRTSTRDFIARATSRDISKATALAEVADAVGVGKTPSLQGHQGAGN